MRRLFTARVRSTAARTAAYGSVALSCHCVLSGR